ncbi:MAG: FkbM family methyltransferase [Acidimicrobiales bacterium]|nr:FkbM family methyltransferase [Acidimicrobiales bacterium]
MQIETTLIGGDPVTFECEPTITSAWMCTEILEGRTYPVVPFVDDVRTVWDAGANVGATTVHFAHAYPNATIHSFEPTTATRELLDRNVAFLPNVQVHPYGLFDVDARLDLYSGDDSGQNSIHPGSGDKKVVEQIDLRAAGDVAASLGDVPIDVLKVDVEGCEVQVLESLGPGRIAAAKVIYVEYDHRSARRRIEELLLPTHELYYASLLLLDQGESVYVARSLVDHPDATEHLADILRRAWKRSE